MPIHFPIWEDIPIHLGRIQPNTFSNASETDLSTPHQRKINTTALWRKLFRKREIGKYRFEIFRYDLRSCCICCKNQLFTSNEVISHGS